MCVCVNKLNSRKESITAHLSVLQARRRLSTEKGLLSVLENLILVMLFLTNKWKRIAFQGLRNNYNTSYWYIQIQKGI